MTPRGAAASFSIERFELSNGLRVVVSPDRSSPTVGVAVTYDVGFRSEPEGRTGFAHLFEHLMFQGSRSLPKLEFDRLIEGNGGVMNGSTHTDFTVYFEILPTSALEVALFGEADRMHEVALNEETLRNQVDVVKEEIKVNVHNRPYGGFPWLHLPSVMFETFPNAHDGYGSFADLEAATLEDAGSFFERYYSPSNAVLAVTGDVDADEVHRLVERHFGPIPARPAPEHPNYGEAVPARERRGRHDDPLAPRPAIALAYRVPDPLAAFPEYLAAVVLAGVLGEGHASRLYERLVKQERLASHVQSYVSTFGDWLATRDPTLLEITAYYFDREHTSRLVRCVDEECARVAEDLSQAELRRVTGSFASDFLRENDQLVWRTMNLAVCEQQRGMPDLINEVPSILEGISEHDVREAAAKWLDPSKRAVLEWIPRA